MVGLVLFRCLPLVCYGVRVVCCCWGVCLSISRCDLRCVVFFLLSCACCVITLCSLFVVRFMFHVVCLLYVCDLCCRAVSCFVVWLIHCVDVASACFCIVAC